MNNWKTILCGVLSAFFSFVLFSPEYFQGVPILISIAKFGVAGGLVYFGIAIKQFGPPTSIQVRDGLEYKIIHVVTPARAPKLARPQVLVKLLLPLVALPFFLLFLGGCATAEQDLQNWLSSPVVQQELTTMEQFAFGLLNAYIESHVTASPGSTATLSATEIAAVTAAVQKQYNLTQVEAAYVVNAAQQKLVNQAKAQATKIKAATRAKPVFPILLGALLGAVTVDHSKMKLGRRAVKTDSRTLKLARYLSLPAAPPAVNYSHAVSPASWGVLLNDRLGDCTIAGILHLLECQAANAGRVFVPTDAEALQYYESIDGYNPDDPSSDQGGIELNVLQYCRKNGIAGQSVTGFASITPSNFNEVRQAIDLFGGIYVGIELPVSAQTQEHWYEVDPDGGVWGGHAVPIVDYDPVYLTCVTWGALKQMSWEFFRKYCDEAYAVLTPDFIAANGDSPSGFDLAQLQTDLAQLS